MSFEKRLQELGIMLPEPPKPVASYVPALIADNFLYLSGMLPKKMDGSLYTGKLGKEAAVEEGYKAAEAAALNGLSAARQALGSLDSIERVVKIQGFVASAEGFTSQPQVLNGASELLIKVFGEAGKHTRIAVGVNELPLNALVEVDFIFKIK